MLPKDEVDPVEEPGLVEVGLTAVLVAVLGAQAGVAAVEVAAGVWAVAGGV